VAIRRIIPISSGKGGVGKTTVAVNFSLELSRHGKTVLVDLDTGTSSVRNAIDVPVTKDLYHFFKKGETLESCVTTLDDRLDPERRFANFGFVAAPIHLIEDITNFGPERKHQIIDAINGLDAEWVVLDLKAGLDSNVLDFLPFHNSGILVFTPHMPAATMAASDVVKAILFRKLRLIFAKGSPFLKTLSGVDFERLVNDLIDQAEDVYDDSLHNLDEFADDLHRSLGDHPVTTLVMNTLHYFKVHYVLNLFNGVDESFDSAIRPFVENLTNNVTTRASISNLGWINRSEAIHLANCSRIPALLARRSAATERVDRIEQELEDLRATAIGLEPRRPKKNVLPRTEEETEAAKGDHLSEQLRVLTEMYSHRNNDDFRSNFEYMVQRALFAMKGRPATDLGDLRILRPDAAIEQLAERMPGMEIADREHGEEGGGP